KGIKFLNYSTDMVFDGLKNSPYLESDPANPLNFFGQSKVKGEQAILKADPDALIIRTGSLISTLQEQNLITSALADLKQGYEVKVTNDITLSFTYVPHLVDVSLDLLLDDEKGIIHASNKGAATPAEVIWKMASLTGANL